MTDNAFLQLKHVGKTYGGSSFWQSNAGKQVLSDINLSIGSQQSIALVGASGSGKSTLCRLILGLEPTSHGEIYHNGKAFRDFARNDWQAYRRDVQLVFQDSIAAVNPRQRIQQVLCEPLQYLRGLSASQCVREAARLLDKVELPASSLEKKAGQLSGGQLQRICIARALAAKPKLIALDESLSGLDVLLQQQIIALLQDIQQQEGTSMLLVTHDLRLVDKFCQQVVVLDDGQLVEQRPAKSSDPWSSIMGRELSEAILPARPPIRKPLEKTHLTETQECEALV